MDLTGNICLVTGASRGIGRGIASQLVYYGATCYVTGRNLRELEEISSEVKLSGGTGSCVAIECDHGNDEAVEKVFERIDRENDGRLDLLVNNAYAAAGLVLNLGGKNFWELSPDMWDTVNNVGLRNNYRCAVFASRLMIPRRKGMIVNISSLGGCLYSLTPTYGIGKAAKDRMAQDCATELKKYKVAFLSLWPGLVSTGEVEASLKKGNLDQFGVLRKRCESPTYVGRAVAALLSEPHAEVMTKTGKILLTRDVGNAHGITDEKGVVPSHPLQLNRILEIYGYNALAKYVPDFVRIPLRLMLAAQAMTHC